MDRSRVRGRGRTSPLAVVALALGMGCGRVGFEPRLATDANDVDANDVVPCVGDLLVDSPDDDAAMTLTCAGAGCSLRAALAQANTRMGSTICVADGLTVAVQTALAVTDDVTIGGTRAAICGTGSDRVFTVATGGALHLRDLTVCHGRLTDAEGAGVLVQDGATLDANRVVFDDHVALSDTVSIDGGAIHADGSAIVEIRRSRFTHNKITQLSSTMGYARGGAIAIQESAQARLLVEDTAFEDNEATNVGGALYLAIAGADLTLDRLLFARNHADDGASVDVNCASTGTLEVSSSTFADNTGVGGVVFVCGAATIRFSSCSFRGNGTELVNFGAVTSRAEFRASAISAGTFDLCAGAGSGTSLGGNIADRDGTLCPLTASDDRLLDPKLDPLADNGGPTATLALQPGSPALDAAGASCPALDQRGLPRPAGAACDAGAFEVQ